MNGKFVLYLRGYWIFNFKSINILCGFVSINRYRGKCKMRYK